MKADWGFLKKENYKKIKNKKQADGKNWVAFGEKIASKRTQTKVWFLFVGWKLFIQIIQKLVKKLTQ